MPAVLRRRVSPELVRRTGLAVAAIAALLLVAASIRAASGSWLSVGDNASIEMRVRDVGSSDTPLLGAYSRFGFLYPGPLLFWVLAVPYRLVGASSLFAAAGLLSSLVVGSVVVVARRSQHAGFALVAALLVLLLARAQGPELLDPWNPWVPVCWFVVLLLTCWRVSLGEVRLLPIGAFLTSFLVQSHLQYAWPALVLVVWSTAVGGRSAWRAARAGTAAEVRRTTRGWWRTGAVLGAVVWLCWIGPLVDHLTSGDSNVAKIVEFVTAGDDDGVDPLTYDRGEALEEVGYAVRPLGPWVTGNESWWVNPTGRDVGTLAAIAVVVVALLVRLRRAAEREATALLTAAALALLGGYLQVLGLRGAPTVYLVRFLWPVAACLWMAILWGAWRALPGRSRIVLRTPAMLALVVVLAGAIVALGTRVLDDRVTPADALLLEEGGPALVAALPEDAVVSVRHRGAMGFMPLAMSLYLEREGRTVAVGEPYRQVAGDRRVEREASLVVTVVEGYEIDDWLARAQDGDDGLELVAQHATDAGQREHDAATAARQALLECEVRDAAGIDRGLAQRAYAELRDESSACLEAIASLNAAEQAWHDWDAEGRWGRYAIFVQPASALRR